MIGDTGPRDLLLQRVIAFAGEGGIAGKSLREIAAGVGTSHRMLLYHFGSREGLIASIVAYVEAGQRAAMAAITAQARSPRELMETLWAQLASPELRPFVRLFFEVFGQAAQGAPGTGTFLESLTGPWLTDGVAASGRLGVDLDSTAIRLGVAATRGLLLDLVAGADPDEVNDAYRLLIALFEGAGAGR